MPAEYNESNIQRHFKEKWKDVTLHNSVLFHWRSHLKNHASGFIRGPKHLETIKALGLRPRAFIRFLVFGTSYETLALVFEILLSLVMV